MGLRPEKKYTPISSARGTRHSHVFNAWVCDPRNIMRFAVLLLSTLGCTATGLAATDLEHRIDALVEASGPIGRGFAGIHVVDLANGKTVYRRNEDKLFLPASNMKLFTTALALLRLGPEYRFVTQVVREGGGDLVLVGSGDPSLSGRVFPYQKDAGFGPAL